MKKRWGEPCSASNIAVGLKCHHHADVGFLKRSTNVPHLSLTVRDLHTSEIRQDVVLIANRRTGLEPSVTCPIVRRLFLASVSLFHRLLRQTRNAHEFVAL